MNNIKTSLEGIKRMLDVLVNITGNQALREVSAFIEAVLGSDLLLEWLERMLNGLVSQEVESSVSALQIDVVFPATALQHAAQTSGIDWLDLFRTVLPILLKLLQAWMDNNDGGGGGSANYEQSDLNRCE